VPHVHSSSKKKKNVHKHIITCMPLHIMRKVIVLFSNVNTTNLILDFGHHFCVTTMAIVYTDRVPGPTGRTREGIFIPVGSFGSSMQDIMHSF
jgi:hypothetical protein